MTPSRRLLSTLFVLLALGLAMSPLYAQRADDSERKSKNAKAEGTIDGVDVTIEYGAPHTRDREIWGGLVPYDQVWRTGADEATTITFSGDVTIEGQKLAAGTYSLFTIPGEEQWTVIFNRVAQQWGHYKYDAAEDALRVQVTAQEHDTVEVLTFAIEGDQVVLHWDDLMVGFQIAKG